MAHTFSYFNRACEIFEGMDRIISQDRLIKLSAAFARRTARFATLVGEERETWGPHSAIPEGSLERENKMFRNYNLALRAQVALGERYVSARDEIANIKLGGPN